MILSINEDYRVTSDEYQFTLQSLTKVDDKGVKTLRVKPKNLGYYGEITEAIKAYYLRYALKQEDEVDVKQLIEVIETFNSDVKELCS